MQHKLTMTQLGATVNFLPIKKKKRVPQLKNKQLNTKPKHSTLTVELYKW